MIALQETAVDRTLEIRLTGRLTADDYIRIVPELERRISESGRLRLLVVMHDFHGWDAGALWEDLKFDLRHFSDIERLALVGETRWQAGMSLFCRPFTTAVIRFFEPAETDAARKWLEEA